MDIISYFKNITLRAAGVDRDLLTLIKDKDISKAKELFEDRSDEVKKAISEYNPESHAIMKRPNKPRKNRNDYVTEKLPRSWQEHINEVELFFLLNNPIKWTCDAKEDAAFGAFSDFLDEHRFNTTMRECKRLAGAETHSAKLYHIFQEDGQPKVRVQVLSKSRGFDLYPLFNQYGQLLAFGVGYYLKVDGKTVEHFDIHTNDVIYRCKKTSVSWDINAVPNPTGKINVVYYRQQKAWRSAQIRIERDEMQDSKSADTNNYFADPVVAATTDVIKSLADPETIGKLIHLQGKDSDFRYIEPPTSNELKESEKKTNRQAILDDTFTPPFDFNSLSGLGMLSGETIRRIMIPGYIKRNRNIEIYDELIDREKNIITAIISKVLDPSISFENVAIKHEFQDPFGESKSVTDIVSAYSAGLLSLESAVKLLGMVDDSNTEVERILEEQKKSKSSEKVLENEISSPSEHDKM